MSDPDFDIDRDEVERRCQLFRDVWNYRPVDHIPVHMVVSVNPYGYTVRDHFLDGEKQLRLELAKVRASWDAVPDGDYIPGMRPDIGCSGLATAFGARVYWSDDPNQTCWIRGPVLQSVAQIERLRRPDIYCDGLIPEGLRRLRLFAEATEGKIFISGLDLAGGLNVALDLMGAELLFEAMREAPKAMHQLLNLINDVWIEIIDASIREVGGINNMATVDFPDLWFPEGKKGHTSDDVSAMMSPEWFVEFSRPHQSRIYQRFGPGGLHNCGPNPSLEYYLDHDPPITAVDIDHGFSCSDMARFKRAFAGRGIIYLGLMNSGAAAIAEWRQIMELMTPDVVVIPCVTVSPEDDPPGLYKALLEIAREYAARMNWRTTPVSP